MHLSTTSAVAQALAALDDSDPQDVLRIACGGVRATLGVDAAHVAVVTSNDRGDDERPSFAMRETSGIESSDYQQIVIQPGQGLGGLVAEVRRPIALHDYMFADSISHDFHDIVVGQEGIRGIACAPVPGPHGPCALLYGAIRSPGEIGDEALTSLQSIANYVGVALQSARANARRVQEERLRERERLAISLHDSVAQVLFGIGVEAARKQNQGSSEAAAQALERIRAMAATANADLRRSLTELVQLPHAMAFRAAIDAEVEICERNNGVSVTVVQRGDGALPEIYESLICDTVREGLRNACKHSSPRLIVIHLSYGHRSVRVAVQTERRTGQQPTPARVDGARHESGVGLDLLQAGARRLGGALQLDVGEDGESLLSLELPLGALAG